MATTPKTLSYEEWLQIDSTTDEIEEVVNGEIVSMPPNKLSHALIIERLTSVLIRNVEESKVHVLSSNFGLVIRRDPLTCRVPDLAVFLRADMIEQDGYVHSPPALIVEVLSPGNTRAERAGKLRDYETLSVPEVWVISPEARTIEILQLSSGKLQRTGWVAEGELRPVRLPGVSIGVASIWPR